MWLHCTKAVLADELKRSGCTRGPGTLVRRRRSRVWLTANERNEPRGALLRVPIRCSGLHRFQCAQHVLDDIVGVLKPNRDPQQAVANTELGALRRRRPRPSDRWHLDEMVVRIAGKRMYLWRAVDHEGEVLDMLVQR